MAFSLTSQAVLGQANTLDKVNRGILEILAQNCRSSHRAIAQALKISKDTVAYRIRQLEEQQLLLKYVLFIDARRLGLTRFHLLIQFESGTELSAEVVRTLAAHPYVMWINSFIGRYDLQIIIDAENAFHLNQIRAELFALCKRKIRHYSLLSHLMDLEFTQLNPVLDQGTAYSKDDDAAFASQLSRRRFPVEASFERYQASALDLEILKQLADDPRSSISALAEACLCTRATARQSILRMIKAKLILNFGAIPNLSALGFVTYYMLVRLEQDTPAAALSKPFRELRNIFYAGRMLGEYDLLLYLNARTPLELAKSIAQFRRDLGRYILHYELLVQLEVQHWRQFSSGINGFARQQAALRHGRAG